MSEYKRIGRREFISATLAGGLGLGVFYLTDVKEAWAKPKPKIIRDVKTLGLPSKEMSCKPYNKGKIKCDQFSVYKNFSKKCPARFSGRCMIFQVM